MECKCVRVGVNTGSCSCVCDAVERGGGGGASKNVAPLSVGPLLTLESDSGFCSSPAVGGAEATNDPAIFYPRLKKSYGVLIVGGAGAGV